MNTHQLLCLGGLLLGFSFIGTGIYLSANKNSNQYQPSQATTPSYTPSGSNIAPQSNPKSVVASKPSKADKSVTDNSEKPKLQVQQNQTATNEVPTKKNEAASQRSATEGLLTFDKKEPVKDDGYVPPEMREKERQIDTEKKASKYKMPLPKNPRYGTTIINGKTYTTIKL